MPPSGTAASAAATVGWADDATTTVKVGTASGETGSAAATGAAPAPDATPPAVAAAAVASAPIRNERRPGVGEW
ncbi:hypothetical protein BIV04_14370 [Frigoribacterium sp. MCBA15_019]|nr:hypothetical protein BIV04_14370 [Frigoribacterium sp. MCBA15_019]